MTINTPENLEKILDILRRKIPNLPETYRHIGERALELVQQKDITPEDYFKEMERYPELQQESKTETVAFKQDLLYIVMSAGDIILKKEGLVPV